MNQQSGSSPIRIAIVTGGRDSYGVKRSIATLIKGFQSLGVEMVYVSLVEGEVAPLARAVGAEVLVAGFGEPEEYGGLRSTLKNFQFAFRESAKLAKIFKDARIDRVIVRTPREVPLVARACWKAGVEGYWLMPNLISDKYPLRLNAWIYELMLTGFGMTAIANSAYTQTSLIGKLKTSYSSHLGIDPADFSPDNVQPAEREKFGFSKDHDIFGIFARVIPEKGQLEFIKTFATAARQFPNARLLICGGPLESEFGVLLKKTVSDLSLKEKVCFSGPSDALGTSIESLYAMCDVIVNCRIDPEPFGLSVIEGMMMAKPLLVHASGGPAETVKDGSDGWHMKSGTVEAYTDGITRALNERDRWSLYGDNARKHALSEFTHIAAAKRILSITETVAAAKA